jgi:peptide/nickel transport system permease protein
VSLRRLLLRRLALGVIALWSVLTLLFVLFTRTWDWALARETGPARLGGAEEEEVAEMEAEYLAERGLDGPTHEAYLSFLFDTMTFRWGESFETGEAAGALVLEAVVRTALYVLPAVALAVAVGVGIGLYAAIGGRERLSGTGRGLTYLLFGVANFWVGALVLVAVFGYENVETGVTFARTRGVEVFLDGEPLAAQTLPFAFEYVLPALLVASTLLAGVVSYARAHSMEYVSADLTKLVRAKGATDRVVAEHVLRNAAIPLVSLLFTETFALLALSVVVIEVLFGIPGIGLLFYEGIWARDLPVLLGAAFVVVVTGVAGSLTQDLAYSSLDPRVEAGSR